MNPKGHPKGQALAATRDLMYPPNFVKPIRGMRPRYT